MSNPVSNAIARLHASAADTGPSTNELVRMHAELSQAAVDLAAVRAVNDQLGKDNVALRAEVESLRAQKAASDLACAEMRGRMSGMETEAPEAPEPAEPEEDYEAMYEAMCEKYNELRVEHAGCAPALAAEKQVTAEVRRSNETLAAQIQACRTEDATESEDDTEEGGCEIEVLRGGDDRIRSLKVRYTK
jgi:hypothetical protein